MRHWIIPANPRIYKLDNALKDLNGVIDWRQYNNFEIGDIVFIYCSKPISQIIYQMEVIATNITSEYTIADQEYWNSPSDFKISLYNNRFFRISLMAENKTDKLTLNDILNHGLNGVPQGALIVKEPLLSYLKEVFQQQQHY
jgi:5-methylcytosine-specific restriction protein A